MRETEVAAVVVKIFVDGERAVEGVELGDDADQPARMGGMANDIDALDAHRAAGGQRARGGDGDGGRLAGAVGSKQAEDLALLELQVDAVDCDNALLPVVDLRQLFDFNNQRITHADREVRTSAKQFNLTNRPGSFA